MEKGLRHFQMQFSIREARARRSVLDLKVLLIKDLFFCTQRGFRTFGDPLKAFDVSSSNVLQHLTQLSERENVIEC